MTSPTQSSSAPDAVIRGGSEMGERLRAFDWREHPLGAPATWPQSLRTALELCLAARTPAALLWGPENFCFYNDAGAPLAGGQHPAALARRGSEVWPEKWATTVEPLLREVERTGAPAGADDRPLMLPRDGGNEECYFNFSLAPIRPEAGGIGGFFVTMAETTATVVGDRRMRTLRELSARGPDARSPAAACKLATAVLAENPHDVPFALFYLTTPDGAEAFLAESIGLDQLRAVRPARVALGAIQREGVWPFAQAMRENGPVICRKLTERLGSLPGGASPDPAHTAMVLPLLRAGHAAPYGFLIAGASPARPLDGDHQTFFTLAASQVATLISHGIACVEERRRADELAQIERAKTVFFSNVSHELRTPLTLLLGPIEEIMSLPDGETPAAPRELAAIAHRNALRLLKLVNTLMDFSRIESGRIQASYEPLDLAALTIELANSFGPAIEQAGLRFTVDCPRLSAPVYVDRDMWEKIVLNLLSNAFKFTFAGEVRVLLRETNDFARLTVQDTGIGIPPEARTRVFERFYRLPGAQGRTHEGTGIGLSLVRELARLHGGDVRVESTAGLGSAFTASVRRGKGHLLAERIQPRPAPVAGSANVAPFIDEIAQWLPGDDARRSRRPRSDEPSETSAAAARPRILVADDNADMRAYLTRLLSPRYDVRTAANGQEALALIERELPQLVLSDTMMPELDGAGLLRAIRARPEWRLLPVILLTARVGEETRADGWETRADDYVVKPFVAREVLARVKTQLELARARQQTTRELGEIESRLQLAAVAGAVGTWDWNLATDSVVWSDQTYRIFGLKRGEAGVTREALMALVHPEDRPRVERAMQLALDDLAPYRVEMRIVQPGGEVRWISVNGQVIADGAGRPQHMLGAVTDITEREDSANALRESERLLRELVRSLPVAVYTCDTAGRITLYNDAAVELWGRAPVVGQEFWCGSPRIFYPDGSPMPAETCPMALALKEGRPVRGVEIVVERPDGTRRHVLPYPSLLRDSAGALIGAVNLLVDITERKAAERLADRRADAPATNTTTPEPARAEPLITRGRILLVDDHATTRLMLAQLLTRRCYEVVTAGSALEARTLVHRESFDLVISDIGLPDGDGCALMTELRAARPNLKGIALSGYGMDDDVVRSRTAGFTEHLIKPINIGKLEQAVTALLPPPVAAQTLTTN